MIHTFQNLQALVVYFHLWPCHGKTFMHYICLLFCILHANTLISTFNTGPYFKNNLSVKALLR